MNLQQITEKILDNTQYNGNKEPGVKAISASEFGSDLLQIYLRHKYGVIDNDKFGQDTLGTLVHIGLQSLFENQPSILIEPKFEHKFDNDWKATGSIDILNLKDSEIIDIKVTKQYTIKKILENGNHSYRWQLSVYKYLVEKEYNVNFDTKLLLILKDGGYNFRKSAIEPSIELLDIEPKSNTEVEDKFYEITKQIEEYNKLDEYPPICNDLWWRKTKSGSIPVRCEQYCSYKDLCPYYKEIRGNPLNAKNLNI